MTSIPPNLSLPEDSAAPEAGPWVVLARIVRTQGRHGEVLADLLTDFPERFSERKQLFLLGPKSAARPIELERHWLHQGRIVFKFAGVDSMNDAETLRGIEVVIPPTERAPLEGGAVYIDDLVGCVLVDSRSGLEVGAVSAVDRELTLNPLLVVKTVASGEVLVPFVKAYRPDVDLAARKITMELPEGLLELNAPASADPSERGKG